MFQALAAAEACTSKWRSAHEAARSQAAARAERMLADCEWKMRELEKKAREADKHNREVRCNCDSDHPSTVGTWVELSTVAGSISTRNKFLYDLLHVVVTDLAFCTY